MDQGDDDMALRRARLRASELASSIGRLEAELKLIEERLRSERIELRRLNRFVDSWHEVARAGTPLKGPRGRNPDRREVAGLALEEIRQAGRPILRRDLLKRLSAKGLSLSGKDPEMVLGTMLYRDERIVRLRGHGYWQAGVVYEPAFYWPEHESVIGAVEQDRSADQDDRGD